MLPHLVYSVLELKPRTSYMLSKPSADRAIFPHHSYTFNSVMLGGKLHLGEVVSSDSGEDTRLALGSGSFWVIPSLCWLCKGGSGDGLGKFKIKIK